MKLRSQLILAFLVLAVLPLAGIVGYSYVSSANAFRVAVQAESAEVATQISVGLRRTREDLRNYVGRLGTTLPFDDPQYADQDALREVLLENLGDSANFVEVLEFVPAGGPGTDGTAPPGDAPGAAAPGAPDRPRRPERRFLWSRPGRPERLETTEGDGEPAMREEAPEWVRRAEDRMARIFGGPVSTPVLRDGSLVGELHARHPARESDAERAEPDSPDGRRGAVRDRRGRRDLHLRAGGPGVAPGGAKPGWTAAYRSPRRRRRGPVAGDERLGRGDPGCGGGATCSTASCVRSAPPWRKCATYRCGTSGSASA